jgi:predicted RNase H-like HicB family nuclease
MQIDFTLHIWKEGDQFVAHAMPLDVVSSGPTPEASRAALDEAVLLFLQTAEEHGTLQEVLEEAGYEHDNQVWRSPSWVAVERRTATVGV